MGDALDWVVVALVDAGEERGAGWEVGRVARADDCHYFVSCASCAVDIFWVASKVAQTPT